MFDWLATPIESCAALWSDEAEWFLPGNWDIVADGRRVRDKATGLEYQHEFANIDATSSLVDASRVEERLDAARAKFLYLKRKTLAALGAIEDLCLVRKEWWAHGPQAEANAAVILDAFSRLVPGVRVMIVSSEADIEQISDRHLFLKMKAGEDWTGDNASWDRAFALADAWSEGFRG